MMKQTVKIKEFSFNNIKNKLDSKEVILFGAGMFIEPTIISLKQKQIVPIMIVDNTKSKQNSNIMGIDVSSPEDAYKKYPEAVVIICTSPHLISEIKINCTNLGWKNIIDCSPIISDFEFERDTFTLGVSQTNFDIDNYFFKYCQTFFPEKLIVQQIDIMITERCSLKCKDCSNLMQYYVNPKHSDAEQTINSIEKFMSSVDYVLEFRVLGGEPLMHKEAYKFINYLRKIDKKNRICIYTNGTIIPKYETLKSLKSDDVFVRISDYGSVSKKVNELTKTFSENGVIFDVLKFDKWQDCARIEKHNESEEKLENKFNECCVKNYVTILNDTLYNCPFSANAHNIGAIPKFDGEYIDLLKEDTENIRKTLFNMLHWKKYFEACKFCPGRPLDKLPLEAAIQVKEPMKFNTYTN